MVARQADWWNVGSNVWKQSAHKLSVLKRYCEEEGRDYDSIRKTFAAFVFIDKTHSKGVEASKGWESRAIAGDPSAVRDEIEKQAELGFDLANLAFMSFPETDDIELFHGRGRPLLLVDGPSPAAGRSVAGVRTGGRDG